LVSIVIKKIISRLVGMYLNGLAFLAPHVAGRRGFYLFCTPLAPPVKHYHRKFFDMAEKSTFEFEGNKIQTYRWGNGAKRILFLHGWQSHSFRWKKYIETFSKEDFTLYALDAPAHGSSGGTYINLPIYSRAIAKFFEQVHPIHTVISHSFGSFAMLYALYDYPALPLERLVIMGVPGEASDFIEFYRRELGLSFRAIKVISDHFEKTLRHPPAFFSASAFAKPITIPGLIVHDKNDEETPYHYAVQIHEAWKNSTLFTTSGLGHNLKSTEVMQQVMDFVSDHEKVPHHQ
jgi:pimeloyl-ACP methyl ester carboxylesterase